MYENFITTECLYKEIFWQECDSCLYISYAWWLLVEMYVAIELFVNGIWQGYFVRMIVI